VFGQPVNFTVTAVDPTGQPVALSASSLPAGATFDPATGSFSWTPAESQQGAHSIAFTATKFPTGYSTGQLAIVVDSGKPFVTDVHNAASGTNPACSPGSLASLTGRWLASSDTPVSDPSGAGTELGGTRVKVNGEYVPLVYASPTRIDFVCPQIDPGTPLTISAENQAGSAGPVSTIVYQGTPGLYSLDGSGTGQGMVSLAGTSLLATSRDYLALGQPAQPGDSIAIRATGIGSLDAGSMTVTIGGFNAPIQSVQAVPGVAGVYAITVQAPFGVQEGDAVPVALTFPSDQPAARGEMLGMRATRRVSSNQITIAVERPQP